MRRVPDHAGFMTLFDSALDSRSDLKSLNIQLQLDLLRYDKVRDRLHAKALVKLSEGPALQMVMHFPNAAR